MATKWEKIDNNKYRLEVEVPAPEVETALVRAYKKVVQKVSMPGFRRGKIPRNILEARFGPEILHDEALEILVPPAYQQALQEADLEPISEPKFELVQMEKGKPLLFNVEVEVMPPVELGPYKGIEAEQEAVEITEEQVQRYLETLREQHARLVSVEEGAAAGDLVRIDFKGFIDGQIFEGGEAENYSLELGAGTFIEGFEEQLVGAAAGEQREIKVKFPDDYRKETLAGKEAVFQVTVKEVKRKELPEVNEDFVKEVSEFETMDEFKADIKQRLEKAAQEHASNKLKETLIEKVTESSKVDLPEVLVERQLDRIMSEMDQYLRYQGLTLEKLAQLSEKSVDDLRREKRPEAEKRTKANLVLDAIIKKEGISVEDHELDDRIAEIAKRYNDQPERVKQLFEKQGRLELIREEMRMSKVIDLLVAEAQIKTVPAAQ